MEQKNHTVFTEYLFDTFLLFTVNSKLPLTKLQSTAFGL